MVFFRPVGSAPILKQSKFKISSSHRFQAITEFLWRQLSGNGADQKEAGSLYLYINSSFAPAADESISNLYACFAVDNTLIVNYSLTPAWG